MLHLNLISTSHDDVELAPLLNFRMQYLDLFPCRADRNYEFGIAQRRISK